MAEGQGDKKHFATERRREQAREEGQITKSADLSSAAMLVTSLMGLYWLGGPLCESVAGAMIDSLSTPNSHAWTPQDGVERIGFTVLADLLAAMGFALLLAAVSVLSGIEITARNGVLWGLGGFIVFQLAPAFGLAPELPGMPAADLVARQVWWLGTAFATGAGLLAIAKFRNWTAIAAAAVLILLPHIIGAPELVLQPESGVPAHLATAFAASALSVGAVFWLTVGPLLGWLNERFARSPSFAFKGAIA